MSFNKKKICNNCNKYGHEFKQCPEPITSWGIILIKIFNSNKKITHSNKININKIKDIKLKSKNDIKNLSFYLDNIKFLLISRKHSLGYIEFIMGRYILSNIDHIIFLIQQMLPCEIEKIKKNLNNFDALWEDLWGKIPSSNKLNTEYILSKKLFNKCNNELLIDIKLEYLLDNIKPLYSVPEYGFPKGRKNKNENEKECAIREFCEETGYNKNDIKLIENIEPIIENMTGTNGVEYRHIYYVAECITDKDPILNGSIHQKNEVGSINFCTFNDAKYLIRNYHIHKINIITNLIFYYLYKIM